jgi:DNA-binding GntR family transcriptional regulator
VRSYGISDPSLLQRAAHEHGQILKALSEGDREMLVTVVRAHLQPAKRAYIDVYLRRIGSA